MNETPDTPPVGRTALKRQAIVDAAMSLFLRNGFRGTSMDAVAAEAGVSKQTVYKQFTDKEQLFRELVEGATARSDAIVTILAAAFGSVPATTREDLEGRLHGVARVYLDGVLQPQVLSLRRLVIAEAEQFPDLAAGYYAKAPSRGIDAVARGLRPYLESGLLDADEPRLAAAHFAYLVLAVSLDRAQFIPTESPTPKERERLTAAATRAFLAAYGTPAVV